MGTRLYVGNLPFSADESAVRALFEQNDRKVEEVKLITDRDTGRPRGFGFVEMGNSEHADQAIADLRYGGIGINCWTGLNYGLVNATWGAFPGHPLDDIESGQGVVHNGLLLDHPQKSVVRAPFVLAPTPAWFTDHKNNVGLGRKMVQFERAPSWLGVPGVAMQALKG